MDKPPPGKDPEIADASLLFGPDPEPDDAQDETQNVEASPSATSAGGYDLDASVDSPVHRPGPPPELHDAPLRPRGGDGTERPRTKPQPKVANDDDASDAVSEVWTRGAEWGPDLLRLGLGLLAYLAIAYFTFNLDHLGLWILILFLGFIGLLVLAYPMLITLERPVRVTPEQAIKDYLGALNHLRPHFRRMWLLLSDDAQDDFGNFDEFRIYWRTRLAEWKAKSGKSGFGNVVSVIVEDFRTEGKSSGTTRISGTGSVKVIAGEAGTTVHQAHGTINFVRASDRMWYLEQGRMLAG